MTLPYDPATVERLRARERVTETGPAGGFAYALDLSRPLIVTAIHAGHRVRRELLPLMALSEKQRLAEEDAATDRIIRKCPSTIWGLDSRAEYDLNRPPELALPLTPAMFWGTRVYSSAPGDALRQRSLKKYEAFYSFSASVIKVLLERFGACIVYDIHSYNIQRQIDNGHRAPPMFNLGTREIERIRWEKAVTTWLESLKQIKITDRPTTVAENDVFSGRGEFCRRLSRWDPNILVLPTEISKFYMDEHSGIVHDSVVEVLTKELAEAVAVHSGAFQRSYCR